MKVYVHNGDTYVGQTICAAIQAQGVEVVSKQAQPGPRDKQEDCQNPTNPVIGEQAESGVSESEAADTTEAEQLQPAEESQPDIVTSDLDEPDSFPLEPNVLVYSLCAADDSIQQALSALAKQKQSSQEQFFIALTTPLSWARTQLLADPPTSSVQPVQQPATDSNPPATDPLQDVLDSSEHTDAALTAVQDAAAGSQSVKLSAADADRRKAAACARAVLEAERTILAAASKDLKTYIVCPGVLYGSGETDDGFHSIFRTAWEAHPETPVPIFGSGQNIIPTIHIADLAAYVAAVCLEPPVQQYLLAVDDAQLSQRGIVSAIAAKMGNTPVRDKTLEELYFQQGMEHMLLDLPMTRTPLASPVQLQYAAGIIANLDSVLQQYIDSHSLQPLRLVLTGPPAVGKSALALRLAQHYQLQLVSAKSILAAVDELGGNVKQEVQTELGGKGGRVSDGNMVKLCSHVLSRRDISMKGFVLEGWPKTAEQAEQLFTRDQPYTPEERQRLQALRDTQAAAAGSQPAAAKGKPAKPDPKGKAAAKLDLPRRHNPIANLFPTHVISLEAQEPVLLSRCLTLAEQEQAAAAAAAAADGKPVAAAASKSKSAGPITHNNDKDFKRRYAAYKASHEGDSASQKATQAAQQLWWDDKRILLEAAAAAEAEAAKAASAKTMRLTALATMGATMGGPSRHASVYLGARSTAATPIPVESVGGSRRGTPPQILPAAAALAAHLQQGVPPLHHGGLLAIFAAHHAQVLVVDANQASGLEGVALTVTSLVGAPHNYSSLTPAPVDSQSADVNRLAASPEAADEAAAHAAAAPQAERLTAEQVAENQHVHRCRAETIAMMAEPAKRCLMQQLMPVLAKAMVDATDQQAADPVRFVAEQLLQAGQVLDLQYVDPYAAEAYGIQQRKWDSKQKREAAREAHKAATASAAVASLSAFRC